MTRINSQLLNGLYTRQEDSHLEVLERGYINGILLFSICRLNKFCFTTELAVKFYFHLIGNKMH